MNRTMKRMALPIGAALILGSSGFAYMAANTVPQSFAGNGAGTISGYTVSDIHYDLVPDAFSPFEAEQESIQHVSFTLSEGASTVRAYINDRMFGVCNPVAATPNRWKCTPQNAGFGYLVSGATVLEVVAAQ